MKDGFIVTQNKGFQMTFKNGLTISVQWGVTNYCERRSFDAKDFFSERRLDNVCSKDSEIAIWDKNDRWFNFGSDNVKGFCSSDEVAEWIAKVQMASSLDDLVA